MIGDVSVSDAAVLVVAGATVGAAVAAAWLRPAATEVTRQCELLRGRILVLQDALRPFCALPPGLNDMCHLGLVPMEQCVRCSKILHARRILFSQNGGAP